MDVVGIGVPCVDLLAHIRFLPKENQSTALEEYSWQGGGKVPTALVTLARLGAETGFIGVVGGDLFGRFCLQDFKRHGVDCSRCIVDEEKETSFSIVLSDEKTGGRNILFHWGSARQIELDDLDYGYISSAKYLHLSQANHVTQRAAEYTKQKGNQVVFDADSYHKSILEMMPVIDVFIASEFFYKALYDDEDYEMHCGELLKSGPRIVVFTLGERGCVGMDEEGFFTVPAFKVKVKDTTGAGDVYHGAFIYGLLQGWSAKDTARFANAVAAIKCTTIGGRAGIPTLDVVQTFLNTGHIDYTEINERVDFYRKRGLMC